MSSKVADFYEEEVDNAVDANLKACEAPMRSAGKVYNVACGASATLLDLIRMLESILGKRPG